MNKHMFIVVYKHGVTMRDSIYQARIESNDWLFFLSTVMHVLYDDFTGTNINKVFSDYGGVSSLKPPVFQGPSPPWWWTLSGHISVPIIRAVIIDRCITKPMKKYEMNLK
jgi:hypothetical protein